MKTKTISFLAIMFLTASCITNRVTSIPNQSTVALIEKDRLEILGQAQGSSGGGRVWVLFIPLGWAMDSWIEGRAYKKALKVYPRTDGLLDQVQTYHKTTIPFILVTPQVKVVKVKGTAYHIRTDAELEEYLKNKK